MAAQATEPCEPEMWRKCDSSTAGRSDGSSPEISTSGQPRASSPMQGGVTNPQAKVQYLSQNGYSLSLSLSVSTYTPTHLHVLGLRLRHDVLDTSQAIEADMSTWKNTLPEGCDHPCSTTNMNQ